MAAPPLIHGDGLRTTNDEVDGEVRLSEWWRSHVKRDNAVPGGLGAKTVRQAKVRGAAGDARRFSLAQGMRILLH